MNIDQLLDSRPFEFPGDGCVLCCNSRGYVMTVKCSKCQEGIDFILWIIVDGNRRPDLLQQIETGTLHDPRCPRCGRATHIESDLLVFRSNREPVLIFSPAKNNTPEESQSVGRSFLLKLQKQMGADWRDEWYEKDGRRGIYVVDRSVLPVLLKMATSIGDFLEKGCL